MSKVADLNQYHKTFLGECFGIGLRMRGSRDIASGCFASATITARLNVNWRPCHERQKRKEDLYEPFRSMQEPIDIAIDFRKHGYDFGELNTLIDSFA